jgi:hypothetical protein
MLGTDLLVVVGFSLVHEWLWSRDSGPALSVALFLSMKHAHPADLMDVVERTEDADAMLAVMPQRIGRLIVAGRLYMEELERGGSRIEEAVQSLFEKRPEDLQS